MQYFEYQVIPAPKKGEKAKGAKTTPDRFAVALTNLMNRMGGEGWEYLRSDILPCEERVGLTGSKTVFQSMLVFRRKMFIDAVDMLDAESLKKAVPSTSHESNLSSIAAGLIEEPAPMDDVAKLDKPVKEPVA